MFNKEGILAQIEEDEVEWQVAPAMEATQEARTKPTGGRRK